MRRGDDSFADQPIAISQQVALAAMPCFAAVIAPAAALLGALDGLAVQDRSAGRGLAPLFAHAGVNAFPGAIMSQEGYTVLLGGYSRGSMRPAHPLCTAAKMPWSIWRRSTLRGRPPGLAGGRRGASTAHSCSV